MITNGLIMQQLPNHEHYYWLLRSEGKVVESSIARKCFYNFVNVVHDFTQSELTQRATLIEYPLFYNIHSFHMGKLGTICVWPTLNEARLYGEGVAKMMKSYVNQVETSGSLCKDGRVR